MSILSSLLTNAVPPVGAEQDRIALAGLLSPLFGGEVYPNSIAAAEGVIYCLGGRGLDRFLGLACRQGQALPREFTGEARTGRAEGIDLALLVADCTTDHAAAVRRHLPFTQPQVVGPRPSFGFGDRLGLATPAHIQAVRGTGIMPVLAQQSKREMTRTQRTPQQVIDDVTWGVFQEGWRDGFGADADHLKTTRDIDECIAAGFLMLTIDPGDFVDNDAHHDSADTLGRKFDALPWRELRSNADAQEQAYVGRRFAVGAEEIVLSEENLLRAAVKYGRAISHSAALAEHLKARMAGRPYDLEISVDETSTPTTAEDHCYVASELKRLGVEWSGLAPRFVGQFQKAVDYIGDLHAFEESFAQHIAIARLLGPYKISVHSGSDKFRIYPVAARLGGDLVHVKTAGTSYLEALRALATIDPGLFREILDFAITRYPEDSASYHVDASLDAVPRGDDLPDGRLAAVLDQDDARQVLHVTFGSVLTAQGSDGMSRFRFRLRAALQRDEATHYAVVRSYLARHLAPFAVPD